MPLGIHLEFSEGWNRFVGGVRRLWKEESNNASRPHLAEYRTLADEAASLASDAGLVAAMQESLLKRLPDPRAEAPVKLYLLEIKHFSTALDAHLQASAPVDASKEASTTNTPTSVRRDLLSDASTLAGSARELFEEHLPWWGNAALHGFQEVGDLFKRKSE
ncbi:MAG TPA: hypothetical protein VM032_15535 [Vicinamibacterales bacterium]|nr:hypothetical protein [Vicinamibacterales bacterium]